LTSDPPNLVASAYHPYVPHISTSTKISLANYQSMRADACRSLVAAQASPPISFVSLVADNGNLWAKRILRLSFCSRSSLSQLLQLSTSGIDKIGSEHLWGCKSARVTLTSRRSRPMSSEHLRHTAAFTRIGFEQHRSLKRFIHKGVFGTQWNSKKLE
jgi:hypothetical protein